MNFIGLVANHLDVTMEGLGSILIFYVILDVGSHLSTYTLKESLRRILSISGIFLAISFVLLLIFFQLFDQSTTLSTFVVVWIASLAATLFASWKLYHKMLEHSDLIQERESDVMKIANRQSEEMLKPLKDELSAVQKSLETKTSMIQWLAESVISNDNSLVELNKNMEHVVLALNNIKFDITSREKKYQIILGQYANWFNEQKNGSEIQTKFAQQVELLLERLDVFLDILDLESGLHETTANKDDTVSNESQVIETVSGIQSQIYNNDQSIPHKLTREDGLRNREIGNQEQLRFSEFLSLQGKNHKCSLLNGTPDFEFHIDGTIKYIGAFKSLTLSVYGSTKQRWIGKIKLLAEIKTAKKLDVSMILFVRNIANGRVWATVISAENLKNFRGITTPLALVDSDSAAEKTCKETLEMALQLI